MLTRPVATFVYVLYVLLLLGVPYNEYIFIKARFCELTVTCTLSIQA